MLYKKYKLNNKKNNSINKIVFLERCSLSKRIGNPDSKYTYNPERLDIDIHNKKLEHDACKQAIRDIILSDPSKMELRYHDAIEALIEIKEEYGL